ncbi:outer membrane protein assembly factor BamD [Catalinimonas niigatensis]|uniref:outer membrane protein assembly factor BamD n=1 Tax=Catalinimonas niigatensis TaxID=1397264 RepID=UPI002666B237|nr:outer membrane protein assembly factor BamD [Catalinimonas niigatensis]WPP52476.1 outer membrane protein assembly factor BamD [Catalinimonas niigatensis]
MQKNTYFTILGIFLLLTTSCSDFRKIQKSSDWQVKYDAALAYYKDKDYYRAIVLLEEVLPIIKGTKTAEEAQYYYAYAHYYERKYILSSHYFKNFYDTYTRSQYATEALYMHAYSLYLQSPVPNLDQTSTFEAIEAMQLFINKYPYSEFKDKAEQILNELQAKLELKAFDNAILYYKLSRYNAAIIAFNNFQKDFPDSHLNEEISYWKVAAQFKLAEESILVKQKERYYTTIEYYQSFIDQYPESKFVNEAENIYETCVSKIQKDPSDSKASIIQ